ncbi:hypothetical protein, partial [Rikenella microfusus]|uniref:hypothetical protein n=2 Tax=Rikenella microfusus TaxID=28139 RepID=UPI001DB90089
RLLRRLRDQKSKQKSRRECDSPFPTSVGTENRTFPEQQPLPVFRYQCKKPEVLSKPTVNFMVGASGVATSTAQLQAAAGGGSGLRDLKVVKHIPAI